MDAYQGRLPEFPACTIEVIELFNNLRHRHAGVDTQFGSRSMCLAPVEVVDHTRGGGGESLRTEHHGAEGVAWQVVQGVECLDIVLLQYAAVEDGARACAGLLGGLPKKENA